MESCVTTSGTSFTIHVINRPNHQTHQGGHIDNNNLIFDNIKLVKGKK